MRTFKKSLYKKKYSKAPGEQNKGGGGTAGFENNFFVNPLT